MRLMLLAAALLASACNCSEAAQLEVEGDHPYIRCHLAEPPALPEQIGGLRARTEARRVTLEGGPDELRLVAFAGPLVELAGVAELEPDLVLVVGDVSADREELADLEVPVVLVGGGLDTFESLQEARASTPPHVIDATTLRSVRVGPLELVVVGGAPDGRYAIEGGCGFGADDVEQWELDAPPEGVSRVLASWAAPVGAASSRASRGLERAEAGSARVAEIAEASGAHGALFAWPADRAGEHDDDGPRLALRRLGGAPMIRADGSRVAPGPSLIIARASGLSVGGDPP